MKIGWKLTLGFVGIALLVGGVGYLALDKHKKSENAHEKILSRTIPKIMVLKNAKNISLKMTSEVMGYVVAITEGELDEERWKEEEFLAASKEIEKWQVKYGKFISPDDLTGLKFAEDITIKMGQIANSGKQIIALKKRGISGKEILIKKEEAGKEEKELFELIDAAIVYENGKLRDEHGIVHQDFANARKMVFAGTGLALLLALCIGFLITNAVSVPIIKLTEAAAAIGKGRLDSRISIKSKDEIGRLAHSFNKMAEDLNAAITKEKEFAAQAILAVDAEKKKSQELQEAKKDLEKRADELARSNKELEEFAYIASHDLQEPLRKVKTFGERLVQKYGEVIGDQGQDYLRRMGNATNRMQTLINDLLTYSRVTSKAHPFEPVNLNVIVHEVLSDLEIKIRETNAEILVDNLPAIEADPVQMRQLFQNLIGNALKFSKPEIRPVVEIRSALKSSQGKDLYEESSMNDYVRVIKVADNGIGFEEKYKEQIFHVFQRLHGRNEYAGTGIGLAVCRKIIMRHGGNIEAESTPGKGSTFIITLPVIQPKEEEKGEA